MRCVANRAVLAIALPARARLLRARAPWAGLESTSGPGPRYASARGGTRIGGVGASFACGDPAGRRMAQNGGDKRGEGRMSPAALRNFVGLPRRPSRYCGRGRISRTGEEARLARPGQTHAAVGHVEVVVEAGVRAAGVGADEEEELHDAHSAEPTYAAHDQPPSMVRLTVAIRISGSVPRPRTTVRRWFTMLRKTSATAEAKE